ncbi:hypothetical protein ACTFIU_006483 [Dictyostelium citrinum]
MSNSNNSKSPPNEQQQQQQPHPPDVLVQLTESFQNFFQSLSPQYQSMTSLPSVNNNNKDGYTSVGSAPITNSSSRSLNNSGSSNSGSSSNKKVNNYNNVQSPTQSQFPYHYQYSSKALHDFEEKRKLLIEQLKSVKINLDTQCDDDPISFIKIRMELTKVKTSLETELKSLDELLHTTSEVEEPNPTPIDSITSLLTMIMPSSISNSVTNNTPSSSTPLTLSNNNNYTSSSSSLLTSPTTNSSNTHYYNSSISSNSLSSNLPPSSIPILNTSNNKNSYPNSIIPQGTPLDNPDPNHPRFPQRDHISVKLYVDCDDYFAASAQAIENATREVFITAWFLSPEVYLIRFPTLDERYRLDNLLKRKAMQGVKIFIILWDETKIATFKGSKRAKDKLEELHTNIKVIKHPPIIPIYWSHHQKTLIVDQEIAFVGGVDFCYGRFDTWCHHLIDVNSTLWKGKDYYNPILGDMGDILVPFEDSVDRKKIPRMPWHDVMAGVNGLAARDVALNFILRWNHHKDDYYPQLYFDTTPLTPVGTSQCQLLRSMDEWSGGGRIERSIHTAYVQAIEDANHYIYIENQNFVSTHAPNVWNQISFEIVKRIKRAIRKKEVFRVYIVIPCQQDGKVEETQIKGLMHWQYSTIIRGESTIMKLLRRDCPDVDLTEYICFLSLRTHAFLEGTFVTEQIYVHSKLMIVDDRTIIVGSANINDRSLIGERDSELAFIIRDEIDTIQTKMNGQDYIASRLVFNFRLRLWKEHLGLLPQINYPPHDQVNSDINNIVNLNNSNNNNSNNNSNNNNNINNNNEINNNDGILNNNNSNSFHHGNVSDNLPPLNPLSNLNSSNSSNSLGKKLQHSSSNPINVNNATTNGTGTTKQKTSHHRSNSFQGLVLQSPGSNRSNLSSPQDSPQESPRLKNLAEEISVSPTEQHHHQSPITDINLILENVDNVIHNNEQLPTTQQPPPPLTTTDSVIIEDYKSDGSNIDNNKSNNIILTNAATTINNSTSSTSVSITTTTNVHQQTSSQQQSQQQSQSQQHQQQIKKKRSSISPSTSSNKLLLSGNGSGDSIRVVTDSGSSPRGQPRSMSSLHDHADSSYCQKSNIDLIDPTCSDFYFGVWIATAASNTRIYDTVFPAIPKNSIKTCEQFVQLQKIPVSLADSKLLSEVRGNLVFHPLEFLEGEDLQPSFLFTDDLFQ